MRHLPLLVLFALCVGSAQAQQSFLSQKALEQASEFEKLYAKLARMNSQMELMTQKYRAARRAGNQAAMARLSQAYQDVQAKFKTLHGSLNEKLKGAVEQLDSALQAEPKNAKLLAARARMAGYEGKGEVAIEMLDRALAQAPGNQVLRLERGRYHFDLMHWDKALVDLDACIKAGHRVDVCRQYKAQVLFYSEKFEEAMNLFKALSSSKQQRIRELAGRFGQLSGAYKGYWVEEKALREKDAAKDDLPRVKLVTSRGEILVELFEDQVPNTVANFIKLVEKKFYDGTRFHRWVPNFLIQGGDPKSKDPKADPATLGSGDPGYRIADEGGAKARRIFSGYLAMAKRANLPNTAGSQFFITHVPAGWLNQRHTVFGRVLTGMAVLRKLRKGDKLVSAVVLRKRDHAYEPKVLPK